MNENIYLPSEDQLSQLIENAWQAFSHQADEAGFPLPDLLKDVFAAGYSYGYNDILSIVRGQFEVLEIKESL
jgi:hypothetical protein